MSGQRYIQQSDLHIAFSVGINILIKSEDNLYLCRFYMGVSLRLVL